MITPEFRYRALSIGTTESLYALLIPVRGTIDWVPIGELWKAEAQRWRWKAFDECFWSPYLRSRKTAAEEMYHWIVERRGKKVRLV